MPGFRRCCIALLPKSIASTWLANISMWIMETSFTFSRRIISMQSVTAKNSVTVLVLGKFRANFENTFERQSMIIFHLSSSSGTMFQALAMVVNWSNKLSLPLLVSFNEGGSLFAPLIKTFSISQYAGAVVSSNEKHPSITISIQSR
jgi:hypothetical protein